MSGKQILRIAAGSLLALALLAVGTPAAADHSIGFTRVSSDPFSDPDAQHQTQVEADTFAFAGIIVSAFQSGRYDDGGSVGIGFAASSNGGLSWTSGHLPGLTVGHGGRYDRVSDASVAYNRRDNVWLISALAFDENEAGTPVGQAILVSRSFDAGVTWSLPESAIDQEHIDKNWIVCDNNSSSPYYGRCYQQFSVFGGQIGMITSPANGDDWGGPKIPTGPNGTAQGWGGQPVVGTNGVVVVPYTTIYTGSTGEIRAFGSSNGGNTWVDDRKVSSVVRFTGQNDDLRGIEQNFPSAEVDAQGRIYVAWSDCRFRASCESGNDIVMSRSVNGYSWTPPMRVTFAAGNHVIPGMAVDPTNGARLGVIYLRSADPACDGSACVFTYGYVTSVTGGGSWSPQTTISPPMRTTWMPNTGRGPMLADYLSASVIGGRVFTVIPIALERTGNTPNLGFDQDMYYVNTPGHVPSQGLPITGGNLKTLYISGG